MSEEEREAFVAARRAQRRGGGDDRRPPAPRPDTLPSNASGRASIPTVARGATTIDALFGPLPAPRSTGRVWTMHDGQLSPIRVSLGVTDGTTTELLSVDDERPAITEGMQLVSFVSTPDEDETPARSNGSPLIPRFGRGRR